MARPKKKVTKMSLVKKALAAGIKKPILIVDFVKKQGMEITAGQASNYKSVLKYKARAAARAAKKLERQDVPASANGKASGLADRIAQLKEIVKELGASEVKKLADLVV